ncbi:MAG: hypothetical protein K6T83_14285 [Alicyclobacillus sp.]|nr:hypothetical protein [Alicyclobacillus sp.]
MSKDHPLAYTQLRARIRMLDGQDLERCNMAFTLNKRRLYCKISDIFTYPCMDFGIYFSTGDNGYWIWGRSRLSKWIADKSSDALRLGIEAISLGGKLMLVEVERATETPSAAFRGMLQQ